MNSVKYQKSHGVTIMLPRSYLKQEVTMEQKVINSMLTEMYIQFQNFNYYL